MCTNSRLSDTELWSWTLESMRSDVVQSQSNALSLSSDFYTNNCFVQPSGPVTWCQGFGIRGILRRWGVLGAADADARWRSPPCAWANCRPYWNKLPQKHREKEDVIQLWYIEFSVFSSGFLSSSVVFRLLSASRPLPKFLACLLVSPTP